MMNRINDCQVNSSQIFNHSLCAYGSICQYSTISSYQVFSCSIRSIPIGILLSILLIGTIFNLLSFGTFCQSNAREMGSGIYRLWIALIGQFDLTIVIVHIIFEIKQEYEEINCLFLEYFQIVLHSLFESLTACVTLERAIVILQGVSFNKNGSKRTAKFIIIFLIFIHFLRLIHYPFYHHLEYSTNRYVCIINVKSRRIYQYEYITNMISFLIPFLINCFSPLIWIIALTKHRMTLKRNHSISINFNYVLYTYRHIIIACYLLVLVNLPRFILMFSLTYIQYQWQNIISMSVYLISLIPLIFSFFIFVILSPKYRPMFFHPVHRIMKCNQRRQYNITSL